MGPCFFLIFKGWSSSAPCQESRQIQVLTWSQDLSTNDIFTGFRAWGGGPCNVSSWRNSRLDRPLHRGNLGADMGFQDTTGSLLAPMGRRYFDKKLVWVLPHPCMGLPAFREMGGCKEDVQKRSLDPTFVVVPTIHLYGSLGKAGPLAWTVIGLGT